MLIPNTMEFFTDPRFVMREVYRVLRPEGLCMVPFTSKGAYKVYLRMYDNRIFRLLFLALHQRTALMLLQK